MKTLVTIYRVQRNKKNATKNIMHARRIHTHTEYEVKYVKFPLQNQTNQSNGFLGFFFSQKM